MLEPEVLTATSYASTVAGTGTARLTITCLGESRYLAVGIGWRNAASSPVQNVTYNGITMSSIAVSINNTFSACQIFGLVAPTANTAGTLVASLTAAFQVVAGAVALYQVHPTTPINATLTAASTSADPEVVITTTSDKCLLFDVLSASAGTQVPNSGQAQRWFQTPGSLVSYGFTDRATVLGSQTQAWSSASNSWAIAIAAIQGFDGPVGSHTVNQMLTRHKVDVFRRFSIKRRLDDSTGEYETGWQDLTDYVKKWGDIKWSLDEIKYSFFQQAAVSMVLNNDTGIFDHESNPSSFWNGYLTRYKTLCRIDAGFLSPDNAGEIPPTNTTNPASTSTQFIGVLTEAVRANDDNEAIFNIKSLSSVLEDIPANILVVASAGAVGSGQLTASNLIERMRDATDGSANFITRKFITVTAFSIVATTQTLTTLDTTTALDGTNCWQLAKKLAEMSNKAVWISKLGAFNFQAKDPTTDIRFVFSGLPYDNRAYGHTIKEIANYEEDFDLLYNRVRVQFGENDTSTSYVLKSQAISVGDSTTAWKYGARLLEFQNTWLNATNADNIASTLFTDLNAIKERVEINCKYIPTLQLLDRCEIEHDKQREGGAQWDAADWDVDNWAPEEGPVYYFTGKEYKLMKIEHDLEEFETAVTLRRV